MKKIGVYPGTFDPVTLGHLEIIERASHFLDHLVVGVAFNQKKAPFFSVEERIALIEKSIAGMTCASRVEVCPFNKLLVSFCQDKEAQIIVRGLRTVADFEYEFQMASTNASLEETIETVFLLTSEHKRFISSTIVKEVFFLGGDVSKFVTGDVIAALRQKDAGNA